ncbi:hypothetical protein BX661DRAFT_179540 [Kickxella alabastrina]|uniref:uncharacterized protein n=1 Tax=Kickxella alabastrina TaxID=61397 RepID=UPI0022206A24|nr:uncharacterized protein BX661DRAFT_179540 [Kickxella alabastrina]KAI7831936.1 hypothetical protein BX661DRAFT_179540 [Kickxella alabastrina]
MSQQRKQPEDPTAHEIIILSPEYHLSIHFPQGSLYADVWLGINAKSEDLLIHLSEMRRKALDASAPQEVSPGSNDSNSSSSASAGSRATTPGSRKDSGCSHASMSLTVRHSSYGLQAPQDWLVAKESLIVAESICEMHHTKFYAAVDKIQKYNREQIPNLDSFKSLLDRMLAINKACSAAADSSCCICLASPYTRLFFKML